MVFNKGSNFLLIVLFYYNKLHRVNISIKETTRNLKIPKKHIRIKNLSYFSFILNLI